MDINYFDLVVAVVILLLGIKGILNGFFKELFGLIGIVGGIFIASRVSLDVGNFLNDAIFHFDTHSAISFVGFLSTLALFWLSMVAIGHFFKRLGALSGLGGLDRLFGFLFGSGKFFLIAAVIAYAVNNIQAVRNNIKEPMANSILFPILVETGGFVMQIDTGELTEKIPEVEMPKVPNVETNASGIIIERTKSLIHEVEDTVKSAK